MRDLCDHYATPSRATRALAASRADDDDRAAHDDRADNARGWHGFHVEHIPTAPRRDRDRDR